MLNVFFLAESNISPWLIIGVLALLLFVVFILPTFTHKKQENQYKSMLDNIKVGYKVKTIGGVVGKVIEINSNGTEKTFTIETGNEGTKSTLVFDMMAVYQVLEPKLNPQSFKGADAEPASLSNGESKTNAEVITKEEPEPTTDDIKAEETETEAVIEAVEEQKEEKAETTKNDTSKDAKQEDDALESKTETVMEEKPAEKEQKTSNTSAKRTYNKGKK